MKERKRMHLIVTRAVEVNKNKMWCVCRPSLGKERITRVCGADANCWIV